MWVPSTRPHRGRERLTLGGWLIIYSWRLYAIYQLTIALSPANKNYARWKHLA